MGAMQLVTGSRTRAAPLPPHVGDDDGLRRRMPPSWLHPSSALGIKQLGEHVWIAGLADHFSNEVVAGTSSAEGRQSPRIGRPSNPRVSQNSSMNPGASQLQRLHFRMS